jgi:predicted metal-dependent enzyme (double-stranded beta helix superfamily)
MIPMSQQERVLGDIATRLLMENDRVKIWEMDLAPGEESDVHEHTMDYILVVLEGDRIAGVPEPDSAGLYNQYIEVDVEPGNYYWIERGGIEIARNIGKKRYREIAIELKD